MPAAKSPKFRHRAVARQRDKPIGPRRQVSPGTAARAAALDRLDGMCVNKCLGDRLEGTSCR